MRAVTLMLFALLATGVVTDALASPSCAGGLSIMVYEAGEVTDSTCMAYREAAPARYTLKMRVAGDATLRPFGGSSWVSRLLPLPGTHAESLEAGIVVRTIPGVQTKSIQWQLQRRTGGGTGRGPQAAPPGGHWDDQGTALLLPGESLEVAVPGSAARFRVSLGDPL